MFFDAGDVAHSFDSRTLERGRHYFITGRVVDVTETDGGITGEVFGTQRQPYAVVLRIVESNRGRFLNGTCSCPVVHNCKHAAAVALATVGETPNAPVGAPDGAVDHWAEQLAEQHAMRATARSGEQIRYALDMHETHGLRRVRLQAFVVSLLKDDRLGAGREYSLMNLAGANGRFITPIDRTIGRLVSVSGLLAPPGLSSVILGMLLEVLMQTKRLHWHSVKQPALQLEPLEHARVAWSLDADGLQRPHLAERAGTILLPSVPLWYADPQNGVAGPAAIEGAQEIAALIAQAPALAPQQAQRAAIALAGVFAANRIEGPSLDSAVRVDDRDPVPVLRLAQVAPPRSHAHEGPIATAELLFAYDDELVRPGDLRREFRAVNGKTATVRPRRSAFERLARGRLTAYGFSNLGWPHSQKIDADRTVGCRPTYDDAGWLRFASETAAQLAEEGWRIEVDPSFPYRIFEASEEWSADVYDGASPQWFELELGIDVEGERISLLPVLIDALARIGSGLHADPALLARRNAPLVGKLPNGAFVTLAPERVARVLSTLAGLFAENESGGVGGRWEIPVLRAGALADLDGVTTHWGDAHALRALCTELAAFAERRVKLPTTFKGELRPYQRDGVAWLQTLREHGMGGILADDMGLGKTVQVLAHIAIERAAKRLVDPVLVVAPTSVVPNWRAESAHFLPRLRVLSLTGADRAALFDEIPNAQLVFTSYALLQRDIEELAKREWSIVVLDEAQAIKNPRAKAAIAALRLRAAQRIALSGTPIENHLEELWSIFAYALPGLLPDRPRFTRLFRTPIEKHGDEGRRRALAARVQPFLLRRTKELVAKELPPKTEIVQHIELIGEQLDLYETIRLAMHKRVREEVSRRGLARSRIVLLDALLKLRQVCCDPRLLKLPEAAGVKGSQKLEALLEMLDSLVEDGRRILLFSQFTSMLDLIKPELAKREMPYVELRGDTRDRETPVARFQNREVPLFLISLKAGGTGLNLTAADTVIHYDPWWNPAVERQATDRAHRIGQQQHVFIYKLIAMETVEERILDLQHRKAALAASLLDEGSSEKLELDIEEIESLFS